MSNRKLFRVLPLLALATAPFAGQQADAAGIQATITKQVDAAAGTTGSITLFLNDSPLPDLAEQTVLLELGDVLRAETSASATHVSCTSVLSNYIASISLVLDPGVTASTVQTAFSGMVETSLDGSSPTSQANVGSVLDCDNTGSVCSALGLPGSVQFISGATSTTIGGQSNSILIHNVNTDTGRMGGVETFEELLTTLNLFPAGGQPSVNVTGGSQGLAIFQATASASSTLELTVQDLTVVPVPAALWLFGSALAGLGLMRRRAS